MTKTLLLTLGILASVITSSAQTSHSEELIQSFFGAFNDTDSRQLDELTAAPFIFLIGDNISYHNTYSQGVDFAAIKGTGWKYSTINSSEVLYEDQYSSQVKINFSRFDTNDQVISTNDVIYTLIRNKFHWKIKSAIILGDLPLARSRK